jgi:hypothetical protein
LETKISWDTWVLWCKGKKNMGRQREASPVASGLAKAAAVLRGMINRRGLETGPEQNTTSHPGRGRSSSRRARAHTEGAEGAEDDGSDGSQRSVPSSTSPRANSFRSTEIRKERGRSSGNAQTNGKSSKSPRRRPKLRQPSFQGPAIPRNPALPHVPTLAPGATILSRALFLRIYMSL